jgi:parvulin-like peptidyl-prolyl isomerase
MAKKQKKTAPERTPTKHQLSKWQRQERIRRIVIIAAAVLLVGIGLVVGIKEIEKYRASTAQWREVVIEVNDQSFAMEYFVDYFAGVLDLNTRGMNSTLIRYMASYIDDFIDDYIINGELFRQAANTLNITVTAAEIDAGLNEQGWSKWSNDRAHRDIVSAALLQEKLEKHFGSVLNATMEQADVQVMLVESREVGNELIAKIEAGGNFTALAEESSCNSSVEGDLGWLPEELMPNPLIVNAAFNLAIGEIGQPIYDQTAIKEVGYWLIEVIRKQDSKIDALVMLLGSQAEAEQRETQLAAGGNFSALAGNYSQHESKTKGGRLDGLKRGDMGSNDFDQVAFNIPLNEISGPVKDTSVQTTGGYWLVKVVDRAVRELEENVKQGLIGKHLSHWFEAWTESSTIENHMDAEKTSWAVDRAVDKVLEER